MRQYWLLATNGGRIFKNFLYFPCKTGILGGVVFALVSLYHHFSLFGTTLPYFSRLASIVTVTRLGATTALP